MPELWLQKTFAKGTSLNSKLAERCYWVFRGEEEISDLSEESTNLF